ncbi:LysM peptidoglycan-binding domain-containing protein [Microaerobacter geothermalis]|uniref:LysM peptidoglycan-binding domain-containing protein n=1 Tax=Microaerobacter geothermalis TaxID=674972 RepID=UPI001F3DE0FD|nr:LysM peptidoglycan-binding domain-containing protein [Microaerobacter geothermalis]MCF6092679.1 LysM peptidoglycan-binding domain-containing protein [Microaerobacter geothermalis]
MSENRQQVLSFDIKETVRLMKEKPGISQIVDIELYPDVDVVEQEDAISIKGNLVLSGTYRGKKIKGKDERDPFNFDPLVVEEGAFSTLKNKEILEQKIPVEVTVPRKRVQDLDDVMVYVDNFDYEIKGSHQLDVTAEFLISGIHSEIEHQEEAKAASYQEPFHFVYVAGEEHEDQFSDSAESEKETERETTSEMTEEQGKDEGEETEEERKEAKEKRDETEEEREETKEAEEEGKEESEEVEEEREEEPEREVVGEPVEGEQIEEIRDEQTDEESKTEEDKDVKVAIIGKKKGPSEGPIKLSSFFSRKIKTPSGESSNLSRLESLSEESLPREEPVQKHIGTMEAESSSMVGERSSEGESSKTDAKYLMSLMGQNGEKFYRLKLCIPQKHESLNSIASRYQLTVEEIMLANGLKSDQWEEGQVLYIPIHED